jgi:hypothetical protein
MTIKYYIAAFEGNGTNIIELYRRQNEKTEYICGSSFEELKELQQIGQRFKVHVGTDSSTSETKIPVIKAEIEFINDKLRPLTAQEKAVFLIEFQK